MKATKLSPSQRRAVREALALVDSIRGQLPTGPELRRLRDDLMVHPRRVHALLRTLSLMAFMDWSAARWAYVCEKIAYEHCLRRRQWRKDGK